MSDLSFAGVLTSVAVKTGSRFHASVAMWDGWWVDTQRTHVRLRGRKHPWAQRAKRGEVAVITRHLARPRVANITWCASGEKHCNSNCSQSMRKS
eukprot:2581476-Prymnesium_polylepis.2